MNPWPACIFTWHGESYTIRWAVEAARLAGFVPIVLDDAAAPLPGTARGWLEAEGVEYRVTTFPRRGNLKGTDCAAGIAREIAAAATRHGTDYALKIDPDTVVLDASLFTQSETAAAVGLTWAGDTRGGAYGMAYALRVDVASAVAAHLDLLPLDPAAPEDLTIWAAARALAGADQFIEHEFDAEGGPFAALPWTADPRIEVRGFGVLTVGNPPPEGWTDRARQTGIRLRQVVCAARETALQRAE